MVVATTIDVLGRQSNKTNSKYPNIEKRCGDNKDKILGVVKTQYFVVPIYFTF